MDFSSFELDPRLTRVLQRNNIIKPTLIQEKAIPLALAGKDILAKAKTGSGKTLSYLLPILHRLLTSDSVGSAVRCLVLVPTKELARQVTETITDLLHYASRKVTCVNLAGEESLQLQKSLISALPSVLVSTPSRLVPHLQSASSNFLSTLEYLVVDEADLVFSFGYADDLQKLVTEYLPKTVQSFLMSATLSPEVDSLKQLVLRNPVTLKLEDAEDEPSKLQQYSIMCSPDDKFLLMYVTVKLKLLKGKLLIFTNDVERCFRLKLFLEQFGIRTCLLNPELPVTSRHHIVDEFNRGVYDIVIASDAATITHATVASNKSSKAGKSGSDKKGPHTKGPHKKGLKNDREGGVARGVDFKRVDVVINFDLPQRADSYVHRVGRTARGSESGVAISFVSEAHDETLLQAIASEQQIRGNTIQPYDFDMHQLDGFRYRCSDALRAITKASIKTARLQAVKEEIIKSEKLKSFFEERPKDLNLLRHDKSLGVIQARPHLKHIPDYLMAVAGGIKSGDGNEMATMTAKRVKLDPLPQVDRSKTPKSSSRKTSFQRKGRRKDPLKAIRRKS